MRSRIKNATQKTNTPESKKGGFGTGSDRNDYYQNDQDTYDHRRAGRQPEGQNRTEVEGRLQRNHQLDEDINSQRR